MSNIAILTAGGIGSRTHQDIPKQFIHVNNKPIIVYTLEAFQNHPNIDEICVAILEGWDQILWAYAKQFNITKLKYVVTGGETGQESIFNGLRPAVVGLLASAALVLMNAENFGSPTEDTYSFVISIIIFLIAFIGTRKYKANPILMIIACGIAGLLLY